MIAVGALLVFAWWVMNRIAARVFYSQIDMQLAALAGRDTLPLPVWFWVPRAICGVVGWPLLLAGIGLWLWRALP